MVSVWIERTMIRTTVIDLRVFTTFLDVHLVRRVISTFMYGSLNQLVNDTVVFLLSKCFRKMSSDFQPNLPFFFGNCLKIRISKATTPSKIVLTLLNIRRGPEKNHCRLRKLCQNLCLLRRKVSFQNDPSSFIDPLCNEL